MQEVRKPMSDDRSLLLLKSLASPTSLFAESWRSAALTVQRERSTFNVVRFMLDPIRILSRVSLGTHYYAFIEEGADVEGIAVSLALVEMLGRPVQIPGVRLYQGSDDSFSRKFGFHPRTDGVFQFEETLEWLGYAFCKRQESALDTLVARNESSVISFAWWALRRHFFRKIHKLILQEQGHDYRPGRE